MKINVNPTHFQNIPAFADNGKDKYAIHVIIETPRDIRNKYYFNEDYGIFKLGSVIAEGLAWPYDYGFIPQTLGDDGDPLDVLFLSDAPTFTGCLSDARLIGIIRLLKNGKENDRLLACPPHMKGVAQKTDDFDDIDDVPEDLMRSITTFLVQYSEEEDNTIEFKGIASRSKALKALEAGHKMWKKKRKNR
jgi:inorganic pyrophosphatase